MEELTEEERLLKSELHRFAVEVIRPASIELDKMPAEDRIKPGSPYFKVMKQMKKLGYHKIMVPPEKGGIA
ncbi:MAG: acyl-CoA dehydrogenase family protein, partial [Archaeoglobaceae archaeon]|nr:acyl-CoA dehydrogenase family protein [Archaeoglobaceae archaeon]